MRADADTIGTPSKRVRGTNGFHVPEAVECASKAGRRETPVRKRINVDGVCRPPPTHLFSSVFVAFHLATERATGRTRADKTHVTIGSPTSKRGLPGFDLPTTCHDSAYGTPANGVAWTPRSHPRCRGEEDSVQNA